ncbi:hypothetical protein AB0C27_31095 [Nonomuraea sp. NPDC048882]|uniref:hypothetical protein n=1 Tax=unclassified Nonomuraea TaxID=2593643 RepID=UPI003406F9F1
MPDEDEQAPLSATRSQDPIVEKFRPDPAQAPTAVLRMTGFLGDSDKPDHRRLYFTRELDYYAEFHTGDVIDMTTVGRHEEPFRGEEATRVVLRRDAMVEFTRTRTARALDEFDLDIRLGPPRSGSCIPGLTDSREHGCPEPTAAGGGDCVTPGTCQPTCETCPTNCGTCYETCVGPTNCGSCVTCDAFCGEGR